MEGNNTPVNEPSTLEEHRSKEGTLEFKSEPLEEKQSEGIFRKVVLWFLVLEAIGILCLCIFASVPVIPAVFLSWLISAFLAFCGFGFRYGDTIARGVGMLLFGTLVLLGSLGAVVSAFLNPPDNGDITEVVTYYWRSSGKYAGTEYVHEKENINIITFAVLGISVLIAAAVSSKGVETLRAASNKSTDGSERR